MEDREIVTLFWQRDERALQAAADKYGGCCRAVARNILADEQDAEECLNDTWLNAWNSIPPHRPETLAGYLAKLTRYAALKRWRDEGSPPWSTRSWPTASPPGGARTRRWPRKSWRS